MTAGIRRAEASDLDRLARFLAPINARPEHRCLMLPGTVPDIRGDMDEFTEPAHTHFVLAEVAGDLVGAAACDWDREEGRGWVMGPFTDDAHAALRGPLFDALEEILPESVGWLDTFTDVADTESHAFYLSRGFTLYKESRIYTAVRDEYAPGPGARESWRSVELLGPAHESQFLDLHRETFPYAPEPGPRLLARRDEQTPIFVLTRGERLLGYLAAKLNETPEEGYVDYLAVRSDERGRGHGHRLLEVALLWIFDAMEMPRASLVVEDANFGARRLYESVGFRLRHEAVSTRRRPEA